MPLVTSEKMLLDAKKDGYAVGAFNVENMEMVKAVIAAAEELNAPVMLQTTPSTVKYGTLSRNMLRIHLFLLFCIWITAIALNLQFRQ